MKRVNTGLLVLQLSILVFAIFANSDAVKQENSKSNRLVKRDVGSQSREDSGKMKKLYSNKEIVAFDDDDELTPQQQPLIAESPSMSVSDKDLSLLSRSQRTDRYYKMNHPSRIETISDEYIDSLIEKLSESARPSRHREKKPAYDLILDSDYYQDDSNEADLEAEADMTLDEIFKSLSSAGRQKSFPDETGDMFAAARDAPVKTVQVKEKLMLENDYNNQLKSNAQINPLKSELPGMISASSQQPSLINQQGVLTHETDPNLSSKIDSLKKQNDNLFMFVVGGCILAAVVALIAAGVCWYTVHKSQRLSEAEYGVKIGKFNSKGSVKSTSSSSGDRRLAQSAQMYHYQHQKQQMIAMEKANNDTKPDNSDNSEGEAEEGDYTVYECPGLAPTGEMVVKNPLFKEDFSQSLNNINSSTTTSPPPPAYATLSSVGEPLVELEPAPETKVDLVNEVANTNTTSSDQQQ